jgi:hypothetical protein
VAERPRARVVHSIRPLKPADEAAIRVFAAIRHLWLVGEWAAGTQRFGTEYMPTPWLENQLAFLLAWERDQLARRLLQFAPSAYGQTRSKRFAGRCRLR